MIYFAGWCRQLSDKYSVIWVRVEFVNSNIYVKLPNPRVGHLVKLSVLCIMMRSFMGWSKSMLRTDYSFNDKGLAKFSNAVWGFRFKSWFLLTIKLEAAFKSSWVQINIPINTISVFSCYTKFISHCANFSFQRMVSYQSPSFIYLNK